jgi:hypothetical protein
MFVKIAFIAMKGLFRACLHVTVLIFPRSSICSICSQLVFDTGNLSLFFRSSILNISNR